MSAFTRRFPSRIALLAVIAFIAVLGVGRNSTAESGSRGAAKGGDRSLTVQSNSSAMAMSPMMAVFSVDRLDDPSTIMKALAERHGFTIYQDHIYTSRRRKRASFEVPWLTPTQVAALRCELAVKHIEFNQLLVLD